MGFFGYTSAVLRRELWRIRHQPIYLTVMVILPLFSFLLLSLIFSGGVPRDIPIAVLDRDNTTLSRKLTTMIDATPTAAVSYRIQDMAEGERMMLEGRIEAIVAIPQNLEKDIYSNTPCSVVAYVNGLNLSANGLLNKDIITTVSTFSTGVAMQILMKKGLSEKQAYSQAMPVYFDKHVLFNPYINYSYYLLPSFMPMMLMIFALMITILAIGSELKAGSSGEWFAVAGGRTWAALIGKLLPSTIIMILLLLTMNTIMFKWIGVPLNGNLTMLTISGVLFVLAYQSIGVLVVSLLSNLRLSLSIGGGYSVLAFTFSGLTFPFIAMDWYVVLLSKFFPFTFYTEIFVDQAMRGAPIVDSLEPMYALIAYVVLPLLCLPLLKKVAVNEKYWRRM